MQSDLRELEFFGSPDGLMDFVRCPDCHMRLTQICRRHPRNSPAQACICENSVCWRYTNLFNIPSWKRA